MGHPTELAHGILMPTQCYPLFENALRHAAGRTAAEHTAVIAELWAGFSRVAATNPYAVDRTCTPRRRSRRSPRRTASSGSRTRSTWCPTPTSTRRAQ